MEIIFVRVDCPDDVAHRIDHLARDASDQGQVLCNARVRGPDLTPKNFGCYCDLGQTRTDIVVEVGSDAGSNALELDQARYAIPVC